MTKKENSNFIEKKIWPTQSKVRDWNEHNQWQYVLASGSPRNGALASAKCHICLCAQMHHLNLTILQNNWLVIFKIVKALKDKVRLRDCHIREESEEIWNWCMWDPELESRLEKRHKWETKKKTEKHKTV